MLTVDETCDYPFDLHEALSNEGLLGLAIPELYGGGGASSVAFCAYVEELAKVSQMLSQARQRPPIWPEHMPGAEGIATGAAPSSSP